MPPELVRAHQALDRAVDAAYLPSGGKRTYASDAERVAFLFDLYQRLTSLLPAAKPKKPGRNPEAEAAGCATRCVRGLLRVVEPQTQGSHARQGVE